MKLEGDFFPSSYLKKKFRDASSVTFATEFLSVKVDIFFFSLSFECQQLILTKNIQQLPISGKDDKTNKTVYDFLKDEARQCLKAISQPHVNFSCDSSTFGASPEIFHFFPERNRFFLPVAFGFRIFSVML